MYIHCSYFPDAIELERRKKTISKAVRKIKAYIKKNNLIVHSIAFSGLSGTLIGPAIADKLGLRMICVRKKAPNDSEDRSHSEYLVEGWFINNENEQLKYIIVDDFVLTGATVKRIIEKINDAHIKFSPKSKKYPECVGMYMYEQCNEAFNHDQSLLFHISEMKTGCKAIK